MGIRNPVVAGRFYPDHPEVLRQEIQGYLGTGPCQRAFAAIIPHAGYIYSGGVAGCVYSSMSIPDRVIILCPNHTGRGADFAVWPEGQWKTPLGAVPVDADLAAQIRARCPFLEESRPAHEFEHSLEVQLPFLQVLRSGFTLVPICIRDLNPGRLLELGDALAEAVRDSGCQALLIASSDMNHYETDAATRAKDRQAIERIQCLDALGLLQTVAAQSISMCGVGPAVSAIQAARNLGARKGILIRYATSGDTSGDTRQVVGYAGMILV